MLGRERKGGIGQASRGKLALQTTKKMTNEATNSMKTKKAVCETKLKRTPKGATSSLKCVF